MKIFQISSNEIQDRFDPKYYDPIRFQSLNKLKILSKNPGFDLYDLEELVDFKISAFYESIFQKYTDNGIPFIKAGDVKKLGIGLLNLTYLPKDFKNKKGKIARLKAGDMVISKGGIYLGNVAVIPKSMKECLMSRDLIGVISKGKVDLFYIASFLSSSLGQVQLQNIKTQQNQPHLTITPMKKVKILVNKKIHNKVSESLKEADDLESKALQLIENAARIFYDTIGEDVKNSNELSFRIKSSELEDVFTPSYYHPRYLTSEKKLKEKFGIVPLASLADIKRGDEPLSKNYKIYLQKNNTDVPFIRTSDIVNYEIDNYPDFVISKDIFDQYHQGLQKGDIVFTNDGKIGLSAVVLHDDECFIQSHIRRIRIMKDNKHRLSFYYIFAFLNTSFALNQIYRRILIQSTISTIGNGLESLLIPILPMDKIKAVEEMIKNALVFKYRKKLLIKNAMEAVDQMLSYNNIS